MAMPDPVYDKFVSFARMACKSPDFGDSDAIQLNAEGQLGDAEYCVGALGRAVNLTKRSDNAIRANNAVREQFLKAIMSQFGGSLDGIPQSVKNVLKIKDFGLEKNKDGTYKFTSGRPLTVRRICRVMTAVSSAKCDAEKAKKEFGGLWVDSLRPRETAMRAALCKNPVFGANGRLNELGQKICPLADKVFRDRLGTLDPVSQNDVLKNSETKAREAAEFTASVVCALRKQIDEMLPKGESDSIDALKRRIVLEKFTALAAGKLILVPQNIGYKTEKEFLAGLDGLGEEFAKERARIDTAFEMTIRIANTIYAEQGVVANEEVLEAQVRGLLEAGGGFISAMDAHTVEETHQKREKGFVQIYASTRAFLGDDKEQALKAYGRLLNLGVNKDKYMEGAVALARLFAVEHVAIPEKVTPDGLRKFLTDLQNRVLETGSAFASQFKEFGSDDVHQLYSAFLALLCADHPEFQESLARTPDAVIAEALLGIDADASGVAASGDNAAAVNLRAQVQMAMALLNLK